MDPACHLDYLDRFGGLEPAQAAFRAAYDAVNAIQREMTALQMDEAEKSRRIDSLQYQIGELEQGRFEGGRG